MLNSNQKGVILKSFLELAKSRKTTYEFSDKKISDSELNKILEAGRWAPSCSDSQPWNFIVIKNSALIDKLMHIVNCGAFHTNPVRIVALVLKRELCAGENLSCFRGVKESINDSFMSIGIAGVSMALEAEDLGISSCLLSPEYKPAMQLLKINSDDVVPLMVGFGYEKKGAFQKPRSRRALKELLHCEFYSEAVKK